MEKVTLLTKRQIENLEVFKKYGTYALPTDFCIMQNGISDTFKCAYWTKTPSSISENNVFRFYYGGFFPGLVVRGATDSPFVGVRPVVELSEIRKSIKKLKIKKVDGIEEIEYGEYPSSVTTKRVENTLEALYQQNKLIKTSKEYTVIVDEEDKKYQEYMYKGEKYVRVDNRCFFSIDDKKLSNGRKMQHSENFWVKVEPIKWLVDLEENIAISKYILTNMPFSSKYDNDYEKSDIKKFLEKNFIKEIVNEKDNVNIDKINSILDLMDVLCKDEKENKKLIKK